MKSFSKKAEAFEQLVGICAGLEGTYKPARQNLQIGSIQSLLATANVANQSVAVAGSDLTTAIGKRHQAFEDLLELAGRIRPEVRNMDTADVIRDKAIRLISRLGNTNTGQTVKTHTTEAGEAVVTVQRRRSTSGFLQRLEAFDELTTLLTYEADYRPSSPDLSVEALKQHSTELHAAMGAVLKARLQLAEARKNREAIFSSRPGGLIRTAREVRNTVASMFGRTNPTARQISSLRFS